MSDFALKTQVASEFIPLVEKVAGIVHKISGNKLGEKQAFMIETRLRKRILELGFKSPFEYISYLDANLQKESGILVGLITTHHTFFFREFSHFELLKKMLPDLVTKVKARGEKTLRVWSAACSRGHEVYSVAMFLEVYLPQIDPTMSYFIVGSDIDQESVKIANNGVYHQNEIKEIPMNFLGNHWTKGTGDIAMYAKIKDTIKKKCQFKPGNLLNPSDAIGVQKFDVVFCRNVFIYFEQHQIEKICGDLAKHMFGHGIFFSGISESLTGYKVDFASVGPSAYILKSEMEAKNAAAAISKPTVVASSRPELPKVALPTVPEVIKVLCVDDSQSIHTLLKRVLAKEYGFQIVATALNGKDAMEKLKSIKVDIVTLDIHMPEMDGIEYLSKNYNSSHPPVVMISSASREDADTAIKALKLGASDFVEKPSLQTMEEKGEEIRTKIKSAISDRQLGFKVSSYDVENSKKIILANPKDCLRVMTATISDLKKIKHMAKNFSESEPPVLVFFEGQNEVLPGLVKEYNSDFKNKLVCFEENKELKLGHVYFVDMKTYGDKLIQKYSKLKISIMCFGTVSKNTGDFVLHWRNAQLLLEDIGASDNKKSVLKDVATDVVPATSFIYMSNVFLSKK
jgi:chemotaxis protein methyltransferase CheR